MPECGMAYLIGIFVFCLIALQIKHWLIDFVFQNEAMISSKGTYGSLNSVKHSAQHALGTVLAMAPLSILEGLLGYSCLWLWWVAVIDFVVHYHVDYFKVKYGNCDCRTKAFWNHLGLDQMVHQFTYLAIVAWVILGI